MTSQAVLEPHSLEGMMRGDEGSYIPQIDGMRALAVLAVVVFHACGWPGAGYAGVDVFFVISGFVITRVLVVERLATGSVDIPAFYVRRIKRLMPGLLVVLLVAVGLNLVLMSPYGERQAVLRSAAASLVFVGNIFFQATSGGYFDANASRLPLLHLWSLGVEEQFYLVWPLVLLLASGRLPGALARSLLPAVLASLLLSEWLVNTWPQAGFYEMPSRFWELGLGGLVTGLPTRKFTFCNAMVNCGAVALLTSLVLPLSHFPGVGAVPVATATALLLAGLAGNGYTGLGSRLLEMRPLILVGRISYPFYLWHWPLIVFAGFLPGGKAVWARLLASAVALVVAYCSDRWIERPLRQTPVLRQKAFVVATLFATVSLACLMWSVAPLFTASPSASDAASIVAADMPSTIVGCHSRGDEAVDNHSLEACLSSASLPVGLVLWGDSHALAMQPFAWALADSKHVAALELTRDSCPPIRGVDNGKRALEARRCTQFNEIAFARAVQADTVVLAARWPTGAVDLAYTHALQLTVASLASHVRQIIILGPTPTLGANAPACMRDTPADCRVKRSDFLQSVAPVSALLEHLASGYRQVQWVDPTNFFCDQNYCDAQKNGMGLYWDDNHISATAARAFAVWFLQTEHTNTPLKTTAPASTKQISPQQYKPPDNK
jgi:peptidoglycan/LPS O-acetylase OafA/YrhL